MIRLSRQSLPDYYEQIPLRPAFGATGWGAAGLGIVAGLLVAAAGAGATATAEILGPLLVLAGGVVLAAMLWCRHYEVTVGTVRIEVGTGPFRDTLATGAVRSVERRPATAWRRLFAAEEVVLHVDVGPRRQFRAPTRDPDGLIAALPVAAGPSPSAVPSRR